MSLKVKWKNNDITDITSNYSWSGSSYQAARTFEFGLLNPAGDQNFKIPDIKVGDVVCFYDGDNKLFHGKVTTRTRDRSSRKYNHHLQ